MKRSGTAHTLVGVQHQRWTVMIWLSRHGHKFLSRNTVTWRQETGGHQHRTHGTLLKAIHEEPGHMLSRGRQSMWRRFQHTPKISQNSAGEWNVVCSATAGTKTAPRIIQLCFNYFAAHFFKALGNEMLVIWKFPKSIAGRVFEIPDLERMLLLLNGGYGAVRRLWNWIAS